MASRRSPPLHLLLLLLLLFPPSALAARSLRPKEPPDTTQRAPVQLVRPNDTWNSFGHLLNSKRGSGDVPGLAQLKRYFVRFGYLQEEHRSNFSDSFDRRFESAVVRYQTNLGLPITGRLDDATLEQISTPRCGVPDLDDHDHGRGRHNRGLFWRFTFFSSKPRWPANRSGWVVLTYALSPEHSVDYIYRTEVTAALRRAFDQWEKVIRVRFMELSDYSKADVKIGFFLGEHGDGFPFDGPLSILAHGFSPKSGKLHFDAAERWAVDFEKEDSRDAIDLESVAVHEIGHILGLGHSTEKGAVMYPSIGKRTTKRQLRLDDVDGMQELYGTNPAFNLTEFMASETSSASRISSLLVHTLVGRWFTMVLIVVKFSLFR